MVSWFEPRLPLNLQSSCLSLPNTGTSGMHHHTRLSGALYGGKGVLFVSSSGRGRYRERMCNLKVFPSFIALSHPQTLNQELVHR